MIDSGNTMELRSIAFISGEPGKKNIIFSQFFIIIEYVGLALSLLIFILHTSVEVFFGRNHINEKKFRW